MLEFTQAIWDDKIDVSRGIKPQTMNPINKRNENL